MSVCSKSMRLSIVLAVIAALGVAKVVNASTIIVVDPGHGGSYTSTACGKNGASGICDEKEMNLNVGMRIQYVLNNDALLSRHFYAVLTRNIDAMICYSTRIAVADAVSADAFIAVHHDGTGVAQTFVEYCDQGEQANNGLWQLSRDLATLTMNGLCTTWATPRMLNCRGALEDNTISGAHLFYRQNKRMAILGEGIGVQAPEAQGLCSEWAGGSSAIADQAAGYIAGLVGFFADPVGASFWAEPGTSGFGTVTLHWEESDPTRQVAYEILQSSNCWGPYETLMTIESGSFPYTNDGVHYLVHVPAPFNRTYYYELRVLNERPRASAPSNYVCCNDLIPVGVPSGLTVTTNGNDVTLAWGATSGATGYYIYRSRYEGMSGCEGIVENIGWSSGPSFVDPSVPRGMPLFYRVRAFNNSQSSAPSGEVSIVLQSPTVGVEHREVATERMWLDGENPSRGSIRMGYQLRSTRNLQVELYSVLGRRVASEAIGPRDPGRHSLAWSPSLGDEGVASGVYLLRLMGDGMVIGQQKLVLVR